LIALIAPFNVTTFVKDGHNYRVLKFRCRTNNIHGFKNIPKMDNPKGNGKPGSYSMNLLQIEKTCRENLNHYSKACNIIRLGSRKVKT
jgi:hypothetical protein